MAIELTDDGTLDVEDHSDHCLCDTCTCSGCGERTVACSCRRKKLTRQERLQGLADRGIDTWEDYRGEK